MKLKKDELIAKLKEIDSSDIEKNHIEADNLLLQYINDKKVTEAFKDIYKWYA